MAGPFDQAPIAALEQRYQVRLPEDFRAYLTQIRSVEDSDMDDELTAWWSVDRIKNVPEEYEDTVCNEAVAAESSVYLFFADSGIWAWAWAINCGQA